MSSDHQTELLGMFSRLINKSQTQKPISSYLIGHMGYSSPKNPKPHTPENKHTEWKTYRFKTGASCDVLLDSPMKKYKVRFYQYKI
jgi:hypothetical protein